MLPIFNYGVLTFLLLAGQGGNPAQAQGDSDCFNSTAAFFQAQMADTRGDDEVKKYVICPDTTIDIGIPANVELSEFVNGDLPLVIVPDNVHLLCGETGSSDNNCVLSGGLGHIIAFTNFALFNIANVTVNNLVVKGLTFTGDMVSIPNAVGSFSMAFAASGENVRIQQACHWVNMTGVEDIVFARDSAFTAPGDFPSQSADVTLTDCTFSNGTRSLCYPGPNPDD